MNEIRFGPDPLPEPRYYVKQIWAVIDRQKDCWIELFNTRTDRSSKCDPFNSGICVRGRSSRTGRERR
jgi:hypothetical protein